MKWTVAERDRVVVRAIGLESVSGEGLFGDRKCPFRTGRAQSQLSFDLFTDGVASVTGNPPRDLPPVVA
ncbi:MAG: hypothetical protein ACRDJV_14325 [Actinomycetota bacterium]